MTLELWKNCHDESGLSGVIGKALGRALKVLGFRFSYLKKRCHGLNAALWLRAYRYLDPPI